MNDAVRVVTAFIAVAAIVAMAAVSVFPNVGKLTMDQISDRPTKIDAQSFPDKHFREYVSQQIDGDGNGYLSKAECESVTTIGSYDPTTFAVIEKGVDGLGISSLEGIGLFCNLKSLVASSNSITNLPVKANASLKYVDMRGNPSFAMEHPSSTANIQLLVDKDFSLAGAAEGIDVRYVG